MKHGDFGDMSKPATSVNQIINECQKMKFINIKKIVLENLIAVSQKFSIPDGSEFDS